MDFLFVPGGTTAELLGRGVVSRKPNTTLIKRPASQNHLAGLLAHLKSSGAVTRPIGDILLIAHGLDTGNYYIPLSRTFAAPADFEKADDADTSNVVRLTAPLLTPSGGGPMNTITVRLRGCNIGSARPFVEKLQQAMTPSGGTLNFTAPLHFDEFHTIKGGWIEHLAHKFTIKVPKQFLHPDGSPDRDALLAAFDAAKFTYLDGTKIPKASWTGWIPKNIHPPPSKWRQSFDTDVDLNPAVGTQTTVTIGREYRYETTPFTWDWKQPDPGTQALRLDVLRNTLPLGRFPNTPTGKQLYDPSYPWPLYERYGFKDINDMVNTLNWKITFTGGVLHFRATRHEYTVMLPITDPPVAPANPVLRFYNFFPSKASAGPAVMNLPETNVKLYLVL
jgi:hypothetical protein